MRRERAENILVGDVDKRPTVSEQVESSLAEVGTIWKFL